MTILTVIKWAKHARALIESWFLENSLEAVWNVAEMNLSVNKFAWKKQSLTLENYSMLSRPYTLRKSSFHSSKELAN